MQYQIEINGRTRQVAVSRAGDGFVVTIGGRTHRVDAAWVDAQTLSLLIEDEMRPTVDTTACETADTTRGEMRLEAPATGDARFELRAAIDGTAALAATVASPSRVASGLPRVRTYEVAVTSDAASGQLAVRVGATPLVVDLRGVNGLDALHLDGRRRSGKRDDGTHTAAGPQRVIAPMPGKIVRVLVQPGDAVTARQGLVVVEAMKMENELRAGRAGIVAEVHAQEGEPVDAGALLVIIQ